MIDIGSDGSAVVKLAKGFYSKKNIVECLDIYSDFLSAKLEENEKNFGLIITPKTSDYTAEELACEFANYLIALEKEKK